eukprot:TRINITY_DN12167_c0_g1_i4.p1 TRINITY_DN12167_c0_g1~~TRINITY_DN12167_c0_g1_i4.p1  ORF type:complete len:267 (-),score=56.78 TRINITY_DN12167_c0_g1_i4:505-1305(-)
MLTRNKTVQLFWSTYGIEDLVIVLNKLLTSQDPYEQGLLTEVLFRLTKDDKEKLDKIFVDEVARNFFSCITRDNWEQGLRIFWNHINKIGERENNGGIMSFKMKSIVVEKEMSEKDVWMDFGVRNWCFRLHGHPIFYFQYSQVTNVFCDKSECTVKLRLNESIGFPKEVNLILFHEDVPIFFPIILPFFCARKKSRCCVAMMHQVTEGEGVTTNKRETQTQLSQPVVKRPRIEREEGKKITSSEILTPLKHVVDSCEDVILKEEGN